MYFRPPFLVYLPCNQPIKVMKLEKIKIGNQYTFTIEYNYGAGSGSQGRYFLNGVVKEIASNFIRVIPEANIKAGNRRSEKVYTGTIVNVF